MKKVHTEVKILNNSINLLIFMREENEPLLDADELEEDLKRSIGDAVHTLTKAGLNLIPIAGGTAGELFNEVIAPPISRRRDQWLIEIADTINQLSDRVEGFEIEDLSENEAFITTVMHATQIAIRNHKAEKLVALKNTVINSALNQNLPEEDLQLMFLDFIDSFTPLHIKLLNFFNESKSQEFIVELNKKLHFAGDIYQSVYSSLEEILEVIFPELKGKKHIYNIILKDLESKDMVEFEGDRFEIHICPEDGMIPKVQEIGKLFLLFIRSPISEKLL